MPIARGPDFDETRAWVEKLSKSRRGRSSPNWSAGSGRSATAQGLARLDYTQNAINKTLVAPYSPRPAAGAPVSAPIEWDELDDPSLTPDGFTIRTILGRIAEKGDLFDGALQQSQRLPAIQ